MTDKGINNRVRWRLGLCLWVAGMLGVAALTLSVIPQLAVGTAPPLPLPVLILASIVQSALLLALVVWVGVSLAPKTGFVAPAFDAIAKGDDVLAALRHQLKPALLTGIVAGVLLFLLGGYASPAAIAQAEQQFTVPLLARILYGGITEELLLRWGLMTFLVWLMWRFIQAQQGRPRPMFIWVAIVVSSVLFGLGHLPAAAMQVGTLSGDVVLFVVGANTVFGIIFGYLYWRYSLEAAMIAHATAHLTSYAMSMGLA